MSRPLTLVLDVTERCNLRCVMCHFARVERIHFPPFDRLPADHGNMSAALFERIARQFFPYARRVALACAAEPLMHPRFAALLGIAARYGVPELWFPTNLLALTEATAEAIARGRLSTVAVSIDGVRKETYEKIRAGATWERLHGKLRMLCEAQRSARTRPPRLRVIFTWMRSNRSELRELPAFAESLGARELDVRFVAPAVGVDLSSETLAGDDVHATSARRHAMPCAADCVSRPGRSSRSVRAPCRRGWRGGGGACGRGSIAWKTCCWDGARPNACWSSARTARSSVASMRGSRWGLRAPRWRSVRGTRAAPAPRAGMCCMRRRRWSSFDGDPPGQQSGNS